MSGDGLFAEVWHDGHKWQWRLLDDSSGAESVVRNLNGSLVGGFTVSAWGARRAARRNLRAIRSKRRRQAIPKAVIRR